MEKAIVKKRIHHLLIQGLYIEVNTILDITCDEPRKYCRIITKNREQLYDLPFEAVCELENDGVITPYVTECGKTIYGLRH